MAEFQVDIKRAFEASDMGVKGYLDVRDVVAATILLFGFQPSEAEVIALIEQSGKGSACRRQEMFDDDVLSITYQLDYPVFESIMIKQMKAYRYKDEQIHHMFRAFDQNNKGFLTEDDVEKVLHEILSQDSGGMGLHHHPDAAPIGLAETIFDQLSNFNNKIGFREFQKAMEDGAPDIPHFIVSHDERHRQDRQDANSNGDDDAAADASSTPSLLPPSYIPLMEFARQPRISSPDTSPLQDTKSDPDLCNLQEHLQAHNQAHQNQLESSPDATTLTTTETIANNSKFVDYTKRIPALSTNFTPKFVRRSRVPPILLDEADKVDAINPDMAEENQSDLSKDA